MSRTAATYAIAKSVPQAVDIYNLNDDAETVVGVALVDFVEVNTKRIELNRVMGVAEIFDTNEDAFDAIDAGVVASLSGASAVTGRAFFHSATVIGKGGMSYIIGWVSDSATGGATSVQGSLRAASLEASSVSGAAVVRARDDFISPSNAYVVAGRAIVLDAFLYRNPKTGARRWAGDIYDGKDRASVVGSAAIVVTREFSKMQFRSSIRSRSYSGSDGPSQFLLGTTPLDNDAYALDAGFYLNTDSQDAATIVGTAINKATWDEEFVINGVASISAAVTEGFTREVGLESQAVIVADELYPTKYDFLADPPPPFGQSGDGVAMGEALVSEENTPYILNSPTYAPKSNSFNYQIFGSERYNYSTAMIAAAGDSASTVSTVGVVIEIGTSEYPGGISNGDTTATIDINIATSRYDGGYTVVAGTGVDPTVAVNSVYPGADFYASFGISSASDGEYVKDTSLNKYYVWVNGSSRWVETNKPVGKYDVGQYS